MKQFDNYKMIVQSLYNHANGMIAKHHLNADVLMFNPSGVADHPDILETVGKELDAIAKYQARLDILNQYFTPK
tara:strand:- start:53 stop:274 length:222 start_codon:yes stop_codon:yes gene_type:complete